MATAAPAAFTAVRFAALGAFAYQWRCELLKLARIPAFVIPTLLFPIMFFTFFGLPNLNGTINGVPAGAHILASFGAYSVLSSALFSFGVSVAAERGLGWTKLMRTTPMNPLGFFLAKTLTAMTMALVSMLCLFTFGALVGHVTLPLARWLALIGWLLIGMIPFVALGLWIGYVGGPNSAAGIANLIFLPMSFASGLFTPIEFLPKFVQAVAPYLPAYQNGRLAWASIGEPGPHPVGFSLAWLVGYTLLFGMMALAAYRRDEGKNFG